MQSVTD